MDFIHSLDLSKVWALLAYQPESPMIFSSGLFFLLFLLFFPAYMMLKRQTVSRIIYVTLFSLFFYYKSSGIYFLLLISAATSDFVIGLLISRKGNKERTRTALMILSLCINLGVLAYFKYFNFIADTGINLLHELGNWWQIESWQQLEYRHFDIFLPVGISFYTFQTMSYIIDIKRKRIEPLRRWIDYVFYVSFFPQLVAGPIVRARDFIPQIYKRVLITRTEFGEGLFLILSGLVKKAIISDYISLNFVDRVFDQPLLYTGVENLLGIYGYALQIYCDFSGYSDMAIGIALLMGIRFNINFDSPYQSATITEFWRRWHISLSSWLKDYLYISLGGNRKGKIRTYMNLMITMLLGGLWHGAALRFVLWGGLHGLGLAVHKFILNHFPRVKKEGSEMHIIWRIVSVFFTFHLIVFGWIFFRAKDVQIAEQMLRQIFISFHPEVFIQFVGGYTVVFVLMLIGYAVHFTPRSLDCWIKNVVTGSPFILQAAYFVLIIFLVFQFKSADVQPFIYFQF